MFYGALPIHFELAKKLRDSQTDAEIFLWSNLCKINIPEIRFKRQHPVLYF
jgi:very-short-patch-repair endonuclease